MVHAEEAIQRLRDGNQRFVNNGSSDQLHKEIEVQQPFAIIVGCADSRVPPEVVFDHGVGELFTVRVAGNVITPAVLGSVEYAAANCGVRLIVVLGHSCCGAVQATMDTLAQGEEAYNSLSDGLQAIVDEISEPARKSSTVSEAVLANVKHSIDQLNNTSDILQGLIKDDGLVITGGVYDLQTGKVEFLSDS